MSTTTLSRIVKKRDGRDQLFDREKLVRRILMAVRARTPGDGGKASNLAVTLANVVVPKLPLVVTSAEIDTLLSTTAAQMEVNDPGYGAIATSVELASLYKVTPSSFSQAMLQAGQILCDNFRDLVKRNANVLDKMIEPRRDSSFSYLAINALKATYLLRDGDRILERPQYMFLRVATYIHGEDLVAVGRVYNLLSGFRFMPASPILYNSGLKKPQLSSCFLITVTGEFDDIFKTLTRAAKISKAGGGIGLGLSSVPAKGSVVDGVERCGVPALLKLFDAALEVSRGANRRPPAITAYLEPWHADVLSFLRIKRIAGPDAIRTNNLYIGLWMCSLFMKRVEENGSWSLFCPSDARNLIELVGDRFDDEVLRLEATGCARQVLSARELWKEIIVTQIETGGPFIMFKEAVNERSNERHLGCITQSNLCTEVVQYCDSSEPAVCNLASIVLPNFVNPDQTFDFAHLDYVTRMIVLTLNRVILQTHTPDSASETSMDMNRAIGIGIQGLADALVLMGIAFDSDEAFRLNTQIAEAIYYAAVDESCSLVRYFGTYPNFKGSPASCGWLQFDHWDRVYHSGRYDWGRVRQRIVRGMTNSLLIAYMPTAGTTQITGCTEGFEPFAGLMFTKKVASGDHMVVPRLLVTKLQEADLWNEDIVNRIVANEGSIQQISDIPEDIRKLFKTVWDVDQTFLVQLAAARAPYVCQSQSMSLYFKSPTISDVSQAIFSAWKVGLKTGMYYLRTRPAARPLPITLPVGMWTPSRTRDEEDDPCLACSA